MWTIIKYELKYNWYKLFMLIIIFLAFTIFSILELDLTESQLFATDYWGGVYSIFLYGFLFSFWGSRVKEKRIRYHSLLPLTQQQNSNIRFVLSGLPLVLTTIYLVIVNLIIIKSWHDVTGSMIGQIGVCIIVFAGFIRARDDWFSHWSFGKRFSAAFVVVFLIQIVIVFMFLEMKSLNKGLVGLYGPEAFHYAKLIFPILGLLILTTTIYSYRKRRSYLS